MLACYSGRGFTVELQADTRADTVLVDLEQIYGLGIQ